MKYGIVLDSIFAGHNTQAGHPERPQRIEAILQAVERWNPSGQLVRVAPLPAQEEWILAVHTREHWQRIQGTSGQAVSQ
ncbi:MAG: histone deacetylase, partial [Acidobacteria bacterium]|nr:histone deacetylase [Acidobacteriota bacterium]